MAITPQQAYRLGSMPWRVLSTFRRSRWPESRFDDQVLELLDQWQALLRGVRDKTLLPELKACRERIEAAAAAVEARKKHHLRERGLRFLRGDFEEKPSDQTFSQARATVEQLLGDLAAKAAEAKIGQKLPEVMRDVHRLGELIGQCSSGHRVDSARAAEIWRIGRRWASEEDLTGQTKGAEPGTSIHRLILIRLKQIDELFSAERFLFKDPDRDSCVENPIALASGKVSSVSADDSSKPYLISPRQAASEFGVSATTLRNEFDKGRIDGRMVGTHRKLDRRSVEQWCRENGRKHGIVTRPSVPRGGQGTKKPPRYIKRRQPDEA